MAYTPAPFNPSTPYQNQVATELNLANQNFTILSQAFLNNDPTIGEVKQADTVDGFHASLTPSANTIPVSNNTGKLDDDWLNFVANDPKVKTALNASNNPPIYACRAWVNFNGSTNPPIIRASGNVSSVIKNGSGGDYIINFIEAMPNNNYVDIAGGGKPGDGINYNGYTQVPYTIQSLKTTSYGRIFACGPSNSYTYEAEYISYAVFV